MSFTKPRHSEESSPPTEEHEEEDEYGLSPEEQEVVSRTQRLARGSPPEPLASEERAALRAFLQRAETRLSTYQRVAGVFLNGAGLLVLLPSLTRESVYSTFNFAISGSSSHAKLTLIPWAFATLVPLYAFVLLLKDLVQFYFSPQFLETDPIRVTRFSLAGVTLPYDEGIEAKAQVIALKSTKESYANFILGGTSEMTIQQAHKASLGGRAAFPLRLAVMNSLTRDRRTLEISTPGRIGVALSLAGSLDLSLVGEVARMESSVARHVLLLRKLVLRYSKALLLFVWSTLVLLVVAALLTIPASSLPSEPAKVLFIQLLFAVWAATSIVLVRRPVRWINSLIPSIMTKGTTKRWINSLFPFMRRTADDAEIFRDPDLKKFETQVTWILIIAAGTSVSLAGWIEYDTHEIRQLCVEHWLNWCQK